jgi:hypothetical protein
MRKNEKACSTKLGIHRKKKERRAAVNHRQQAVIVGRITALLKKAGSKTTSRHDRPGLRKQAEKLAKRHRIALCF